MALASAAARASLWAWFVPPARLPLRVRNRAAGITTAEPFVEVRRTLEARKAAGLHGGMAFTYRQPARSTDPEAALRSARALVVGARSYLVDLPDAEPGGPSGRIARRLVTGG